MCTLALYFRVFDDFPLLVAANRDEHFDRPSAPPGLICDQPRIIAGQDLRVGGTWLGVNEHGLVVGILNRRVNLTGGEQLPPSVARSRGLLCLDLLRLESTAAGWEFIRTHRSRYNPFTVAIADKAAAFVAYNNDEPQILAKRLAPGLHVFSSAAELDLNSDKADRAHQRFAQLTDQGLANGKQPGSWTTMLQGVLADHTLRDGSNDPGDAICVHRDSSGTVSSSVIVYDRARSSFETFFCSGAPCQNQFGKALNLDLR
jgi:uncharacterized protein with NRDE domain